MKALIEKFWEGVSIKDGDCWEWSRGVGSHGYGQIYKERGKPITTHRFSWAIHFGDVPNGMFVLHHCDNKRCVNPFHLFLGTQADNMKDMCAKGRHAKVGQKGDKNGNSKLTDDQTEDIKKSFVRGTRQNPGNSIYLANKYGVSAARIGQIGRGEL